jgi:CheY-like chemotaxis protein
MRLLVTETDPLVRRWLGLRAEELGVQLEFASSGSELLAAIGDRTPDCVVMDASSSTDERAPLWRQLRDAPETCHIPILLYSSSSRWQTVAELAGATVDGFLPRPFTPDTMLCAVQRLTNQAAA